MRKMEKKKWCTLRAEHILKWENINFFRRKTKTSENTKIKRMRNDGRSARPNGHCQWLCNGIFRLAIASKVFLLLFVAVVVLFFCFRSAAEWSFYCFGAVHVSISPRLQFLARITVANSRCHCLRGIVRLKTWNRTLTHYSNQSRCVKNGDETFSHPRRHCNGTTEIEIWKLVHKLRMLKMATSFTLSNTHKLFDFGFGGIEESTFMCSMRSKWGRILFVVRNK